MKNNDAVGHHINKITERRVNSFARRVASKMCTSYESLRCHGCRRKGRENGRGL